MIYGVVAVMLFVIIYLAVKLSKANALKTGYDDLQKLKKDIQKATAEFDVAQRDLGAAHLSLSGVRQKITEENHNLEILQVKKKDTEDLINTENQLLKEKRDKAVELAQQDAELVKAKMKEQLDKELEELKANSELEKYKQEIKEAKATIDSLHQLQKQELEQEDFEINHTILLTPEDKEDIDTLRNTALHRKSAINKFIWSEYVMHPLQDLRKTLDADKICGIYKITDKETQMAYVGQALSIGKRWTEHAKSGLGVDSISYLTNKFYKNLYKKGIDNFTFEILEECNKKDLDKREKYWIDFLQTVEFGYNSKSGNN